MTGTLRRVPATDPGAPAAPVPTRPTTPPRHRAGDLADWLGAALVGPVGDGPGGAGGASGAAARDVEVTGLSLSSQRVHPGDLYAALPGQRAHGASYAAAAVAAGAVAVLTDPAGAALLAGDGDPGVPVLVVPHPREVLGRLAAHVHGDPATALTLVAVTGTQGKTTTTRLLESALERAGVPAAVVGTVGTRVRGTDVASSLTTPEAPDLHALFAVMRERGVAVCAMEVSSHALVMGRVDGVRYDVAVFTNLGRDHLDFHADVEDYYQAKARLFAPERTRRALVNLDDEHGRRLAAEVAARGEVAVRTFSARPGSSATVDWWAEEQELEAEGSRFVLRGPDGLAVPVVVPLPGDFNVANALAALAAAGEAGLDVAATAAGMAVAGGVPGRLERVPSYAGGPTVVVDYAHKPDAVEAALRALRPVTAGRLVVVLGAGGDRDPGKRPLMGEVAARLADVVVVTDDNPRSEDPAAIRAAVLAGVEQARAAGADAEVHEVGDRRAAVTAALTGAGAGDVVVLAGKGHETGQEVAGVVHPFDDRTVAAEVLATLAGSGARTGAVPASAEEAP